MSQDLAAVVMAAGLGTRMRSQTPKHLHPLLGRRMVDWVIEAARPLDPEPLVVVTSPQSRDAFDGLAVAVQETPRGTGDAVRAARSALDGRGGDVLVLSGDTPLLTTELLRDLVDAHRREGAAATALVGVYDEPRPYGRIVRDGEGKLQRVVEVTDASDEELAIREMNTSIYVFRADALWPVLERLEPQNAQGELYLTDALGLLVAAGEDVAVHRAPDPVLADGVNTRAELAAAAAVLRERVNHEHMLAGVTIVDPATTWIEAGVEIEPDVTIHPFTVIRGEVSIASGAEIGPFAYVRPGTVVGEAAKIGTFVEVKNTRVGRGAKVPHLSYMGDADIGEGTNIGASNVTANFDHRPGQPKKRTKIGRNVRTAVDNTFVAPVEVGDDAWIAAGTVITDDVPPGSLAGFPPRQVTKEGYVYREHGKRDE
jgi:bifunctional UDP-N-acetylglucosamine pyrophosphorylase / glucosamine-1-phosphate N-acetyltransferase